MSLLTLLIALALTAQSNRPVQAYSERMYGPVSAGDFKVFKVRMQTNLVVPKTGKRCLLLRTWHAMPTYRPWCNARSPVGMLEFRCDPTAKMETEKDNLSTHLYWEERQKLSPGQSLSYVSYFKVLSPRRTFNPSTRSISWSDIESESRRPGEHYPVCEAAAELAKSLKTNHDPANSIVGFCKWLQENIKYDATVSHSGDDAAATIANRRGHCGHILTVFRQMCTASGIKTRLITGLNLQSPSGYPDRSQPYNPQPNAHVWAEVYLPNIGWIEVEPMNGEKCFDIPANFVQNNSSFQNCAVWFTESDNVPRQAQSSIVNGKLSADYGMEHLISYTQENY